MLNKSDLSDSIISGNSENDYMSESEENKYL